jgi:hypothetical protein
VITTEGICPVVEISLLKKDVSMTASLKKDPTLGKAQGQMRCLNDNCRGYHRYADVWLLDHRNRIIVAISQWKTREYGNL